MPEEQDRPNPNKKHRRTKKELFELGAQINNDRFKGIVWSQTCVSQNISRDTYYNALDEFNARDKQDELDKGPTIIMEWYRAQKIGLHRMFEKAMELANGEYHPHQAVQALAQYLKSYMDVINVLAKTGYLPKGKHESIMDLPSNTGDDRELTVAFEEVLREQNAAISKNVIRAKSPQ